MVVNPDDFQAVILAGGKGSRMTTLLFGKPKCLLPIANKPMISYPLELLIRSGIKETFVILLDNEVEEIKSAIAKLDLDINVKYVPIPHDEDWATANSVRSMYDNLEKDKDVLLLSCDTVTDLNLDQFIQLYRLQNPTFTCLLSSIGSETKNLVPAKKLNDDRDYVVIGHDTKESNRLVLFEHTSAQFGRSVPLKKSLLMQCPTLRLQKNLQDVHIYLLKNWVFDYLKYKESINSIKGELVPSIVRKQFRKEPKRQPNDDSGVKHIFDFVKTHELYQLLDRLDSFECLFSGAEPAPKSYPNGKIKCYAQTVTADDASYCLRVNNWVSYCEASRMILSKERAIGGGKPVRSGSIRSNINGLVGTGSAVGKKCTIKRTVIGANCRIAERVQLINCILLDNVTVGEGAILEDTVVCYEASIGAKAKIKGCILGPKLQIAAHCHITNESVTVEELDAEDDF